MPRPPITFVPLLCTRRRQVNSLSASSGTVPVICIMASVFWSPSAVSSRTAPSPAASITCPRPLRRPQSPVARTTIGRRRLLASCCWNVMAACHLAQRTPHPRTAAASAWPPPSRPLSVASAASTKWSPRCSALLHRYRSRCNRHWAHRDSVTRMRLFARLPHRWSPYKANQLNIINNIYIYIYSILHCCAINNVAYRSTNSRLYLYTICIYINLSQVGQNVVPCIINVFVKCLREPSSILTIYNYITI